MDSKSLPNGFISIDEAVKLIRSNTFEKPTVNIRYMASHLDWCEYAHNFTIPKVRLMTKEEYFEAMKARPGRRPSELVDLGAEYVTLYSQYDVELLKKEVLDNFALVSGRQYEKKNTRGISTVMDQETTNDVIPRAAKKTVAKEGDLIGTGSISTTNSADGAGL